MRPVLRASLLPLCLLGGILTLTTPACVGEDPGEVIAPGDAGTDVGNPSNDPSNNDGGSTAPVCRADQILCDGACVDIGPQHCGGCTTVCPSTAPLCASGAGATPSCVSNCAPNQAKCGEQCVVTETNPSNCGSCGNKCATPLNGVATCANSTCDFTCKNGFHACGAACAADDDITKCGATCKTCPAPANGAAACTTGACTFTCGGGLTVCATQGVCANTQTDKNHCGACGKGCQVATACTTGACIVKYGNATPFNTGSTAVTSTEFTAIPLTTTVPITVTHLGMYAREFVSQHTVWLALYANNGGHPGARLAQVSVLVTATGVKEIALAAPVNIAAGTYFVGATQSGFAKFGMNDAVGTYEYVKNVATPPYNASNAPSPAPATTTFTGSHNLYLIGKEQ